jgi:hypothetical protein
VCRQQLQEKNKDLKSHVSPNEKRDGGMRPLAIALGGVGRGLRGRDDGVV